VEPGPLHEYFIIVLVDAPSSQNALSFIHLLLLLLLGSHGRSVQSLATFATTRHFDFTAVRNAVTGIQSRQLHTKKSKMALNVEIR